MGGEEGTLVFLKFRDKQHKQWTAAATVFWAIDENGMTKPFKELAPDARLEEFQVVTD